MQPRFLQNMLPSGPSRIRMWPFEAHVPMICNILDAERPYYMRFLGLKYRISVLNDMTRAKVKCNVWNINLGD